MRVLAIVHQRDAGPGVFAETIRDAGAELEEWIPAERPQPPTDPFGYDAVLVLGGVMNVEVSRADALHWIDDYETDPDAVRIGIDPAALGLETEEKIGAFNQLGRDLCRRWLEVAR
jgi:GMP synthase-like glutamine amidotransferase